MFPLFKIKDYYFNFKHLLFTDKSVHNLSMAELNRNDRYSGYSDTQSVYYNSEMGDSPGYGIQGERSSRRRVFRAMSIRNEGQYYINWSGDYLS